jgi:phenylacetate-coenzyme A ligase PaaK-like adenylate-forming protein
MNRKNDIMFRPWREIQDLQNRNLQYFITRKLYPFSPFYRKLFDQNQINPNEIKTVQDLQKIPFTTKKDFIDTQRDESPSRRLAFVLQPNEELIKEYLPKGDLLKLFFTKIIRGSEYLTSRMEKEYRPIFLTATAGTTHLPIPFLYSSFDLENLKISGKRIVEVLDIKIDERAMNVFPYAPHLAFWQTFYAGTSANIFIISTGGGKTVGTKGNVRTLLKLKPHYLIGIPGYVYHMLKTARSQNRDLSFLKCIVLGAARVPKGFKEKLSKLLYEMGAAQVSIIGTYGFTESRTAWAECPTEIDVYSGYHTSPDKEVFEVIDPDTGEVKGEGEDGELVYSNIDARGTCVLRYRTGDLVRGGILYSPCPHCGRTVPRISNDIVRASNVKNFQLTKIKGTVVNLNNLEYLLEGKSEIDEWQIEIAKKDNDPFEVDELILYVSLLKEMEREEFVNRLNDEVLSSSEISFNHIRFVSPKEIQEKTEVETAVKAIKIVDKRPKV